MSFPGLTREDASNLFSALGEPCAVLFAGGVYSTNPDGQPIFVFIEEGLRPPVDEGAFTPMSGYTGARIAKYDVPEISAPSEGMRIVCNDADDSRGSDFQGGAFAGQVWHVDKVDVEYAQTWHFRVTPAESHA